MLQHADRRALVVLVLAAAFVVSRGTLRDAEAATHATLRRASSAGAHGPARIWIRRDPFAGAPSAAGTPRRPAMASIPVWLPATPLAALPPNAGARSVGPPVADATFAARIPTSALPRLAAVVTGFHPYALLTAGSSVRIVTVGDVIAGKRVEQIAERRLLLAGGARLDVDPSAHAVAVH